KTNEQLLYVISWTNSEGKSATTPLRISQLLKVIRIFHQELQRCGHRLHEDEMRSMSNLHKSQY
ncbi:hypothetical protein PENTCL1PPCAC_562, partial [Pristionchus entomophagus]